MNTDCQERQTLSTIHFEGLMIIVYTAKAQSDHITFKQSLF